MHGAGLPRRLVDRAIYAPGLLRLELLRQKGRSLFQGERALGSLPTLYPSVPGTAVASDRIDGTWVPETGLLPPIPLVKGLFASPVMAAMASLNGSHGSFCRATRLEPFSDGVISVTFGETSAVVGRLEEALLASDDLDDQERLGDWCVNVVPRAGLPRDRFGYPIPGEHVSFEPLAVRERVYLTAGDARLLKKLFERVERPWFENITNSCAPMFGGPFRAGGNLQFHEETGDFLPRARRPTDADGRAATARSRALGELWLKRVRDRAFWIAPAVGRAGGLTRLLSFMEENCTRQVSVSELAEQMGVSSGHLHAIFRAKLGCTPLAYLADRRLDLAERLLTETTLSVAEISERCGFSEQSSLTHCLKRRRGVTPLAFRRSI